MLFMYVDTFSYYLLSFRFMRFAYIQSTTTRFLSCSNATKNNMWCITFADASPCCPVKNLLISILQAAMFTKIFKESFTVMTTLV